MDLNSSFKSAQSKFYKWTTDWTLMGENPEINITPDLLDLITIFQILGFTVCHADAHDPHDISKLSCGEKGLKLSVSCGHSGVRFVLEGINECSCSEKMVDSIRQQMLLEDQTQKNESLANIRLLNVPAGEKLVIQTVLTHLVKMMHAAAKDNDQNENVSKTEIKNTTAVDLNTTENIYTPNIPIKHEQEVSPTVVMSPGRHRSLDTLTGMSLPDELPEPGNLKKEDEGEKITATHSSPNLTLPLKPSNISSPVANVAILKQGYSKLLSVQEMVKDVIEILEKAQEIPKFSFDVSHIKASTESLCVKKSTRKNSSSDPDLIVKRNVKLLCRPSIRSASSASSVKSTVATSSGGLTKPRKSTGDISPNFKAKPLLASATKSQKFAHVKSTIPKGSTYKKP